MTVQCATCAQPIEEHGLLAGRCHGCRAEHMDLKNYRIGHPRTSKRWENHVPSTPKGRRSQLLRSTAKKLDALLDRLTPKH